MASTVRILVLSTSNGPDSKSERLARLCLDVLASSGADVEFASLKDHRFPPFHEDKVADSDAYQALYPLVDAADGLVLASPVYNWSLCAGLKDFIEHVGSTDGAHRGAMYDKVVSFVCAAGLPHSYMAFAPSAISLMLDFKCIVNPYQVYVHNRGWDGNRLVDESELKLRRAMAVMLELTTLLCARSYRSDWCV